MIATEGEAAWIRDIVSGNAHSTAGDVTIDGPSDNCFFITDVEDQKIYLVTITELEISE